MLSLSSSLSRFLDWWLGELDNLLSRVIPPEGVLRLHWSRDTLVACYSYRERKREILRLDLTNLASAPGFRQAARAAGVAGDVDRCPMVLRFEACHAPARTLEFPAAAASNLQQVLSWEMDRLTPFSADDVYFGWRLIGRMPKAGGLRIQFAFLPRSVVDRAVADLARSGTHVQAVEVAWEPGDQAACWSVRSAALPASDEQTLRISRWISAGLAGTAIALGIAVAAVPFYRQQKELKMLEEPLARLKAEADAALDTRRALTQMGAAAQIVLDARSGKPSTLQVLDELTQVIPDGTWLDTMRYADAAVDVSGHSNAASALVGLIENSPIFAQTRFLAPVTRDPQSEAESFRIGFRVVRGEMP
jgi:general secretion pathway protein L